jgi:hypothetical protein
VTSVAFAQRLGDLLAQMRLSDLSGQAGRIAFAFPKPAVFAICTVDDPDDTQKEDGRGEIFSHL